MAAGAYQRLTNKRALARARHVWLLYWACDMTGPEIAAEMGLSRERIYQLLRKEQAYQDKRLRIGKSA
jgi:hypothetical protein